MSDYGQLKPLRASWTQECSKVPLRGPVEESARHGLCLYLYTDILHNWASYGHEELMVPDPKVQRNRARDASHGGTSISHPVC